MLFIYADINECELNVDNCDQTCTDLPGSYFCNCSMGYELNVDGHTCDGKNEFLEIHFD